MSNKTDGNRPPIVAITVVVIALMLTITAGVFIALVLASYIPK